MEKQEEQRCKKERVAEEEEEERGDSAILLLPRPVSTRVCVRCRVTVHVVDACDGAVCSEKEEEEEQQVAEEAEDGDEATNERRGTRRVRAKQKRAREGNVRESERERAKVRKRGGAVCCTRAQQQQRERLGQAEIKGKQRETPQRLAPPRGTRGIMLRSNVRGTLISYLDRSADRIF